MNKIKLSAIICSIFLMSACSNVTISKEQTETNYSTSIIDSKTKISDTLSNSVKAHEIEITDEHDMSSIDDSTDDCFKIPVEDILLNSKNYSDRLISQSKYDLMYTSVEGYKCKIIRHGGCSDNGCVPAWQNFNLIAYNTSKESWNSEKELIDWFKKESNNFKWIMNDELNELLDAPHVIEHQDNIDWLHCIDGDSEKFGITISNDSTELYYNWY